MYAREEQCAAARKGCARTAGNASWWSHRGSGQVCSGRSPPPGAESLAALYAWKPRPGTCRPRVVVSAARWRGCPGRAGTGVRSPSAELALPLQGPGLPHLACHIPWSTSFRQSYRRVHLQLMEMPHRDHPLRSVRRGHARLARGVERNRAGQACTRVPVLWRCFSGWCPGRDKAAYGRGNRSAGPGFCGQGSHPWSRSPTYLGDLVSERGPGSTPGG